MSIRIGGGTPCKHGVIQSQGLCRMCPMEKEIKRLKALCREAAEALALPGFTDWENLIKKLNRASNGD
jgi:hypothetical protein